MTGTYYFANQSNVFKSRVWGPQGGAALLLLPFNPKWSLLMDGQVSFVEVQEGLHNQLTGHPSVYFYRLNPNVPNEDFTTQSQVSIFPSLVRMVRKRRFSVYLGGGLGVTHLPAGDHAQAGQWRPSPSCRKARRSAASCSSTRSDPTS